MTLTSIQFVLFTVLALGVYYFLPWRFQNYWLLLISYTFVISWDWQFAIVLGVLTVVNFVLAQKLFINNQGQRRLLWLAIGFNVFVLICFRAASFFLPGLEALLGRLGIPTQAGGLQILIPLGLSYYVLQIISYLVDVYRGQLKAERNWVDFSLYLAYFPKLIAGPIERARSFLPKLAQPRVVDNPKIARSALLIFVGMVRKLLIADILTASILLDVFEIPAKYTPPELIGWLVIYAFALYNDFAGYTSIVRGVSGLFGIELSPNFRTPYFARSFAEFWNRWHITLSEWLRDYIYFPLSRALSRRNPGRGDLASLILPPMITMLVSGMWHGLSLHMFIWGGLHGLYQILERVSMWRRPMVPPQNQPIWKQSLSMVTVFTFVILAWIPFRWELPAAFDFWGALLDWSSLAIRYRRVFFVIPFLLGSLVIDLLQYHNEDEFIFLKWPRMAQAACMAFILLLIFMTTGRDFEQPFVYQAF
jgi:D-alanyl-lipoteichoic acid acyltransferase DltB (MBOAT superfamily)